MKRVLAIVAALGCGTQSTPPREQRITEAVKRERLGLIRDAAAQMGVHNAVLFGGIAKREAELAHCASEVGFGCPGPASPSCHGTPVIAGGADGPCSALQGGLGMFQFDAGTHAQTLATYGDAILTVEGNTAQAVAFVIDKVLLDIEGVTDWRAAAAWLSSIPLVAGEPRTERWARLIACRYNGCCSTSTACTTRANRYRDNAIALYRELGAEFWRTADRCAAIPEDGVIDQRTACYIAGGDPRYWRRDTAGHGNGREWTNSTRGAAPSNFGMWLIRPPGPGSYRLEAYISGGAATASYEVRHAGHSDRVVIDQAGASGFQLLGTFDFAGDGDEYVLLGDNTGTADQKLVFDALYVVPPDGPAAPGTASGGCTATGDHGHRGFALVLVALLALACRYRPGSPRA